VSYSRVVSTCNTTDQATPPPVIKHPLALDQIKSRLSATPSSGGAAKATIVKEERYDGYDDVAQVKHDFDIVFNNAKRCRLCPIARRDVVCTDVEVGFS
jgi:hypothetical protein